MEFTSWPGSTQGQESGIITENDQRTGFDQANCFGIDGFDEDFLKYRPSDIDGGFEDLKVKAHITSGISYSDSHGDIVDWNENSDSTQQTMMSLNRDQLAWNEDICDLEPRGPVDLSTVSSEPMPLSFNRNYSDGTDIDQFGSVSSNPFTSSMSSGSQRTQNSDGYKSDNYDQLDGFQHRRNMSDAFTMQVPLVNPSHNDGFDNTVKYTNANSGSFDDSQNLALMQTPIREGPGSAFDRYSQGSPMYLGNGLESPMESPNLQSPYLAFQPFPAVPHAITPTSTRKMSTMTSPLAQRASSSASQVASPMLLDIPEKGLELSPQTPRASKSGVCKPRHKRSASSVSLAVTPKSLVLTKSNSQTNLTSDTSQQPLVANPSTPVREPTAVVKEEVTPKSQGKRDGRRRIAKDQITILERNFHLNPRPERDDRIKIAEETKLEQRTVQIWFQNRRAKARSMKMPPSRADLSKDAVNYRAAQAAASNALIGANARPSISSEFDHMNNSRYGPDVGSESSLAQMSSNGNNKFQNQLLSHQQQPRWHSGNLGSPSQSAGSGYHQQLPKFGVLHQPPMQVQHHQMQKMQHYQNQRTLSSPVLSSMTGPQYLQQQQQPNTRLRSFNKDAPEDGDADYTYFSGSTSFGRPTSRSNSMVSPNSASSMIPQSPMNERGSTYATDGSLQNSPELISPVAWPSNFGRSQSVVALNSQVDWTGSHLAADMKRRRSLYGTAVPNSARMSEHDHASQGQNQGQSHIYPHSLSDVNLYNGSIAASAAAAALRTRNRSHTQPSPRSRQPSVRLQLNESNNTAEIVVITDENERNGDGVTNANNRDLFRQLSPGRAERAAVKTIKRRSAR